jgi:hypothetical protein
VCYICRTCVLFVIDRCHRMHMHDGCCIVLENRKIKGGNQTPMISWPQMQNRDTLICTSVNDAMATEAGGRRQETRASASWEVLLLCADGVWCVSEGPQFIGRVAGSAIATEPKGEADRSCAMARICYLTRIFLQSFVLQWSFGDAWAPPSNHARAKPRRGPVSENEPQLITLCR